MPRISPFVQLDAARPRFDNSRHLARLLYRLRPYLQLLRVSRKALSPADLLRLQFPHLLPDAPVPPSVSIELTNACNLACTYCTSPLGLRPRGVMAEETLEALYAQLAEARIPRVRLVGNGEPTLHPRFADVVTRLASVVPYVSLVTNGTRLSAPIVQALLSAPLRLVEVSVEGLDATAYAASRRGGRLPVLLENLDRLRRARDAARSPTLILLRLMLRPSDVEHAAALELAWRPRADVLMRQYIVQRPELPPGDAFDAVQRVAAQYPRCTLPFKELTVTWTGDVPLCQFSAAQLGEPGLLLGNLRDVSLAELWQGRLIRDYRVAHRRRDEKSMPMCRGCASV